MLYIEYVTINDALKGERKTNKTEKGIKMKTIAEEIYVPALDTYADVTVEIDAEYAEDDRGREYFYPLFYVVSAVDRYTRQPLAIEEEDLDKRDWEYFQNHFDPE